MNKLFFIFVIAIPSAIKIEEALGTFWVGSRFSMNPTTYISSNIGPGSFNVKVQLETIPLLSSLKYMAPFISGY